MAQAARPPLASDLAGRLAVVTGAAHGIGEAIARRLLDCGVRLIAIDVDEATLNDAFRAADCELVVADLGSETVADLAGELVGRFGPVELIVNNVGVTTPHRFLELDRTDFDRVFDVNLRGPWFFTKRLVEALVAEQRTGAILFISSLHDTFIRRYPHYSASKASVAMVTKELAYELAPHGIRVNAISPGSIATRPGAQDAPGNRFVPAGRAGEPDDVARMAVALLSEEFARYVTGANVPVDGGLALHNWLTS